MDNVKGFYTSFVSTDAKVRGLEFHIERMLENAKIYGVKLNEAQLIEGLIQVPKSGQCFVRINYLLSNDSIEVLQRQVPPSVNKPLKVELKEHCRPTPERKWFDDQPKKSATEQLYCKDGRVLEGATWALVAVVNGEFVAPKANVLPSTTIAMFNAYSTNEKITQRDVTLKDLFNSQELVSANSTHGFRPIIVVDGVDFNSGSFFEKLLVGWNSIPTSALS